MNILNIIILFILIIIIGLYIKNNKSSEQYKPVEQNIDIQKTSIKKPDESKKYNEDHSLYLDKILKSKEKISDNINSYFLEQQYHRDYSDTIDAIQFLLPNNANLFNNADLPVSNPQIDSSDKSETRMIKLITSKFIKEINKTVKNNGDSFKDKMGWGSSSPNKKIKSGWDTQQEKLGLPTSVFVDPASNAPVKLIKIDHIEKYKTDEEVKYTMFMIIQKLNAKDQMVVKTDVIINNRDVDLERDFFKTNNNSYNTNVKIEHISIVGFLTMNNIGSKESRDKFYDYEKIYNGEMFVEHEIIKQNNKNKMTK